MRVQRGCSKETGSKFGLVLVLVFTAVYFFSGVGLSNSVDAPQYRLTQAIVDRHTFYIDGNLELTSPDVSSVHGHMISGRSPGESFLAVPFYAVARWITPLIRLPYDGHRNGVNPSSGLEASTAIMNAIFGGLSVCLVFLIAFDFTSDILGSLVACLSFGLGTLMWKYSSVFYRHSLQIFFVLLATFYLLRIIRETEFSSFPLIFAVGLGGALLIDPTSIGFVAVALAIVLWLMIRRGWSASQIVRTSIAVVSILLIFYLPILIYGEVVLGRLDQAAWQYQVGNPWLANPKVAFSTPLLPSVLTNLFNPGTSVTQASFSAYLRADPKLAQAMGYQYVADGHYTGIFVQSPFLFLMVPSYFLLRRKSQYLVVLLLAFVLEAPQFKYLVWYSPNSFDSRFFLPMVALLSPLVSPFVAFLRSRLSVPTWRVYATAACIATLVLILDSVFNAWVAELQNYAPHLTGQNRVLFADLIANHASLKTALIETFPNIFDYRVFLFYCLLGVALYFVIMSVRCVPAEFRRATSEAGI